MLNGKISCFVYIICLKFVRVSCFLTFIGRPNAAQIYTEFKCKMKSHKICLIKLLLFFVCSKNVIYLFNQNAFFCLFLKNFWVLH